MKTLTRASAVQNLYWMMCNGVDTYEQVVRAVELHETAHILTRIALLPVERMTKPSKNAVMA